MKPFNFSSDDIKDELNEYTERLSLGAELLANGDFNVSGVSERRVIYQQDNVVLYHYTPLIKKQHKTPLLIVYALVNRPYMLDIHENRSLIKGLLSEGQDVYLIDWGYPDLLDCQLTLDDYINGYLNSSIDMIRRLRDIDRVNVMGVCQGGCISLCYASLYPEKIQNLITMVTPVDFKTPDNLLSALIQHVDVDQLVDTYSNISGDVLSEFFLSLKPFLLKNKKYIDAFEFLDNEKKLNSFMLMEKWIFDSPDQAGETFRQFIKDFYQKNKLMLGEVEVGNQRIDLNNIKCPVLNIYAKHDHIVPPKSSKALRGLTQSSDYQELGFSGGHIGIYVSRKAQNIVAPSINSWLNSHLAKT